MFSELQSLGITDPEIILRFVESENKKQIALADAEARKAEADAEARKADAEARKADAEAKKADAEARIAEADAEARKVEAEANTQTRIAEADVKIFADMSPEEKLKMMEIRLAG